MSINFVYNIVISIFTYIYGIRFCFNYNVNACDILFTKNKFQMIENKYDPCNC